jgi:hypothetical protein
LIKRAVTIAKYLAPLIITFFIARVIYTNWQQVRDADWILKPHLLLLSLALAAPWLLVRPWIWQVILGRLGHQVPYYAAFAITRRAELSRFIPGAIWHYVSRVYLAGLHGVPVAATLAASLVETVLVLLASIAPAVWSLDGSSEVLHGPQALLLIVVPCAAFLAIHPRVLNLWAGFIARRFEQPYEGLKIRWISMLGMWALALAVWLTEGLAVSLFARGVLDMPPEWTWLILSEYAAAWLIGMITMIAPAGMGIRDGAFGLLLARRLPLGTALTLAVAVRLWLTIIEVLFALLGPLALQRLVAADAAEPSAEVRRNTS